MGFIDPGRDDRPIAVGLAMDVDAVAVDVNLPKALVTGHELAPVTCVTFVSSTGAG